MKIFVMFDATGALAGSYPEDVFPPAADGSRNATIPSTAQEIDADQWADLVANQGLRRWDGSTIATIAAPAVPIPSSASKLGLVRALREKGDWTKVKAALATNDTLQDDWDAATTISRSDPLTQAMIATMSYASTDVDALLVRAAVLGVT